MLRWVARLLRVLLLLLFVPPVAAESPRVLHAEFSGIISPVAVEYLNAVVARGENESFDAVVISLDTPGGLDLSMREIVKTMLAAEVPIIVYVSPAGARAASAGVFITMAAHVAAMSPGTNIGAAHPVSLGGRGKTGGQDSVMSDKITNDAAAYLKAIASKRGRNGDLPELFVAKSTSITSAQAVALDVVDLEAETLEGLLAAVDGMVVKGITAPLRTKGAVIVLFEMTGRQRFLATVSDPNIAMVLMSIGVTAILIELYSPGLILPGIVGVVSLVLAFYSFQTLSASYAGIIFIGIGFLLFLLELKVVSFGLLALGGTASLIMGYLMLFKDSPGLTISKIAVLSTVGTMLTVLLVVVYIVKKTMFRKAVIGLEGSAGEKAVAKDDLDPNGTIFWHGELWRAESLEGNIPKDAEVVIVSVDGLMVRVKKQPPAP